MGKHFVGSLVMCLSIKTGTRRIMRPDKLPIVVRPSRRIVTKDSSALFTLETDFPLDNSPKKDNTS